MKKIQNKNKRVGGTHDLVRRTIDFGKAVIHFCKKIPENSIPRKDFAHKIGVARKEANETVYWLNMIKTTVPKLAEKAEILEKESRKYVKIFSTIIKNTRSSDGSEDSVFNL